MDFLGSLAVKTASTVWGVGSTPPGQETKISHVLWCSQKLNKQTNKKLANILQKYPSRKKKTEWATVPD